MSPADVAGLTGSLEGGTLEAGRSGSLPVEGMAS